MVRDEMGGLSLRPKTGVFRRVACGSHTFRPCAAGRPSELVTNSTSAHPSCGAVPTVVEAAFCHDASFVTRGGMRLPIYQVDAFTARVFGGNPAAVCPIDAWLDDATLQAIA